MLYTQKQFMKIEFFRRRAMINLSGLYGDQNWLFWLESSIACGEDYRK